MENREVNCRFWFNGYCAHEDAPKANISCIGKGNCSACQDGIEHISEDNYRLAKELNEIRKA